MTGFDTHDCSDFRSQAQAKAVLRADPTDPNRLESPEGQGVACTGNPPPFDWIPVRVGGPSSEPLYTNLVGRWTLAFLALDDFDWDLLDQVVQRQEERFGHAIRVLPDVEMPSPENQRRGNLQAEDVIKKIKRSFPEMADDPTVTIIALTSRPLYQWELHENGPVEHVYAHYEEGRLGVISVRAMSYDSRGELVDEHRFMSRLHIRNALRGQPVLPHPAERRSIQPVREAGRRYVRRRSLAR